MRPPARCWQARVRVVLRVPRRGGGLLHPRDRHRARLLGRRDPGGIPTLVATLVAAAAAASSASAAAAAVAVSVSAAAAAVSVSASASASASASTSAAAAVAAAAASIAVLQDSSGATGSAVDTAGGPGRLQVFNYTCWEKSACPHKYYSSHIFADRAVKVIQKVREHVASAFPAFPRVFTAARSLPFLACFTA